MIHVVIGFVVTTAVLVLVIVGLGVWCWREVCASDRLGAELNRVAAERDTARAESFKAKYELGRAEQRLDRLEREQPTRPMYLHTPVNGRKTR